MNIVKNIFYMARRFKTATALNLLGLVVAYAAFYLLMTQVIYNRSYNQNIADGERVFRFESKMGPDAPWGINCNRPFHRELAELPQVEALSELATWSSTCEFIKGETTIDHLRVGCNLTPFGAINARCLDGQLDWTDYGQQSAIIPASLAQKLFGRLDVAGEPLFTTTDTITVQGVYEDFPANCSMKNYVYYATKANLEDYSEWSFNCYVKLRAGVDANSTLSDLPGLLKEKMWTKQWSGALADGEVTEDQEAEIHARFNQTFDRYGYRLVPITETYFSGVSGDDKGNPSMLFVLELACLLMLVVAAINFLNFTLAESPMRVKSINTRRVLGEGLGRLRCSLVGESIVLSLLACCLALGLCAVVAQEPTELLVGELGLTEHWGLVALMLGLAVLLGVAAGAYPAWFVTSFQPALALKGSFGLTPKGRQLRSVLVSLQLVVAIFMVCYIGILLLQSRYIYNSDYGFAKDEVLYAQLSEELWGKKPAIRAELMQLGGVSDVSFSRFVLGSQDGYMGWGRGDDDHRITFTCMPVDWHYLRTMGIRVTAGRDFNEHDGDCYIINEAARRQWPWVEIDKKLLSNDYPVVGICEDVRFTSTRKDRSQEPMAFFIFGEKVNWGDQLGIVNIRVAAGVDKVAMRQQVRKLLTDMGSGEEIGVNFLDSQLENLYQEEFRFIRQVIAFSVVCLLITLIGVFCLTLFETEYRRKEIGIRKIMGSSVGQVLLLLARRYVWLLGAAFVIAVPLAWHFGSVWLQNFAERTPIYWWLFPLAMLVVALLTLATVVLQSWRTALENPINTIKTE